MKETLLSEVIDGAPLVVCLGPGGVGKTTISAVLALHQAAAGCRSLVLTIDPARRLADALGLPTLTNDPVAITSYRKMHPVGSLSALMLDPSATFDHLIALLVGDSKRRQALLANRVYQHVSRYLAGTLEYMAVERLHELTKSGQFEAIVLDTPPTTNALDFLEAPERLARFFNDKVIGRFMPQPESTSWGARLWHRASSSVLSLLTRAAGEGFVEDVIGFVSTFGDLFGHFRARGIEVGKTLRDPRTRFLIVCAPDPNRLAEARAIDQRLGEARCRAHAFIVNRVDEPFLPASGADDALLRATILLGGAAERERVRLFIERLETMRRGQESAAATHAGVVKELREYAGKRPVFVAPRVPLGQSPRASLLALYVGLFADAADPAAVRAAALAPPAPPSWTGEGRRETDRR
jgi:anion-transporting  ArsA/GET3 family ATPase